MGMIKTKGIVVASTSLGEHDKLLTVLSEELGAINVSAKGATSRHNNLKAMTRVFCCGEFVLYDKKNGYYTISEVSPITDFMGLAKDIDRLEAANSLVKFVKYTAVENEESGEMLRLLLNSLHLLANTDKSIGLIKCVYYLKALEYMGLPPVTDGCAICGQNENTLYFVPEAGGLLCEECAEGYTARKRISATEASFMNFVLSATVSEAFGVNAKEELFEAVAEHISMFLREHLAYNM